MQLVSVEFEDDVGPYGMRIIMEAQVIAVDHGIGDYEFWGSKGHHTDIRQDLNLPPYVEEVELIDDDGEKVTIGDYENQLIKDWVEKNLRKIEEKILEKASIDC
jgi:hypothetical protein